MRADLFYCDGLLNFIIAYCQFHFLSHGHYGISSIEYRLIYSGLDVNIIFDKIRDFTLAVKELSGKGIEQVLYTVGLRI